MVALGELADIVSGATPKSTVERYWGGDVHWATPADLSRLQGAYISETPRRLTEEGLASCAATLLPAGSILLSSRAPIGHVAINEVPMATNQGFKSLVPRADRVDPKYLYYWLRSKTAYLSSLGNGATFKELSKSTVSSVEVPLPTLRDQKRIIEILDQAAALRAKSRLVASRLDLLKQSHLHRMLADRGDPVITLESLVDPGDRINYGVVQPGNPVHDGIPLIRIANLAFGAVDRSNLKRISPEIEKPYARSRIRGNEVLVSCVGSVGIISIASDADVGSNIARAIARIPISDSAMRTYVAAYLETGGIQRYFRSELRTVAQPTLNIRQLAATKVPMPPAGLVNSFYAYSQGLSLCQPDHALAIMRA